MTITLEYEDGSVTQEEFQKEVTELGKAVLEALQKQGRCRIGVVLTVLLRVHEFTVLQLPPDMQAHIAKDVADYAAALKKGDAPRPMPTTH